MWQRQQALQLTKTVASFVIRFSTAAQPRRIISEFISHKLEGRGSEGISRWHKSEETGQWFGLWDDSAYPLG